MLHPGAETEVPYVTTVLGTEDSPVVAVSDWMRAVPDLIRPWVPVDMVSLGTDGFGFSDTRPAARRHFLVDAPSIAVAVLAALAGRGQVDRAKVIEATNRYQIDNVQAAGPQLSDSGAA
jgi:pyruvate dehydrogenase E1 component